VNSTAGESNVQLDSFCVLCPFWPAKNGFVSAIKHDATTCSTNLTLFLLALPRPGASAVLVDPFRTGQGQLWLSF
jgi:hypothetical protein